MTVFRKREDRKSWLRTIRVLVNLGKVCSMKEREQPERMSIYIRLFSVSRPGKEGHSPMRCMLQSFNLRTQKHAISDSGSCSKCFSNMSFCSCCLEARDIGGRIGEGHIVVFVMYFDSLLGRSMTLDTVVLEKKRTGAQ